MDRALGERLSTPHLWEVPAEDGDVLLAVSDGVTDNLTFSELRRLLGSNLDGVEQTAQRLVDAAYARSRESGHPRAKIDDITAVAARVRRVPPISCSTPHAVARSTPGRAESP
jgi:serine/threonine protein phosphatase PrpC